MTSQSRGEQSSGSRPRKKEASYDTRDPCERTPDGEFDDDIKLSSARTHPHLHCSLALLAKPCSSGAGDVDLNRSIPANADAKNVFFPPLAI
jgi:hypothetical protein